MSNKLIIFVAYGGGGHLITPSAGCHIIYKPYKGYSRGGGEFMEKVSKDYADLIESQDYVSFMGDDCQFKAGDMLKACEYGFHLFQLAMTHDSYYSWKHLLQSGTEYRHVPFIEMMFTMSVEFWRDNKKFFSESKSGWGLDYLLSHNHKVKYNQDPVVFDKWTFKHTRPVNSAGSIDGKSKSAEMWDVINKYNLHYFRQ